MTARRSDADVLMMVERLEAAAHIISMHAARLDATGSSFRWTNDDGLEFTETAADLYRVAVDSWTTVGVLRWTLGYDRPVGRQPSDLANAITSNADEATT